MTFVQCHTGYWFPVAFRHICQFSASSGVRFFCFFTPFTSFSYFISDFPLFSLSSGDQVNIRLVAIVANVQYMAIQFYRFGILLGI
jgi:hypothetical protein